MSQYWGRWRRHSEDQPVLTKVVGRSQADTAKKVPIPSQIMVLPGYKGMQSPQGDLYSGHRGGVVDRIMAPKACEYVTLQSKGDFADVIKSRISETWRQSWIIRVSSI